MSDNAPQDQPPVSSETLLLVGPILIGALFSWMLFGVSVVQIYLYHISFPRERWPIQATVYIIFLLDTFQSIVVGILSWKALCSGWGRPINLQFPGWTFGAIPCVSSIIAAWVQIFYAWRIYQLGKWRVIPCIIIAVALAQAGGANAIGISFASLKDIARLHDTYMYARTIVWLGGGAFTDVVVTFSMVYLLYAAKKSTHSFRRSERMVNRLIRLTVETGTACAISAILELAFFLGLPETNLHVIVAFTLSKIYSNTLMTSLNSRALASNARSEETSLGVNSTSTGPSFGVWATRSPAGGRQAVVHISRETEVSQPTRSTESKAVLDADDAEMLNVSAKEISGDVHVGTKRA